MMSHIDDDELGRRIRADVDRMVADAGDTAPPPLGSVPTQGERQRVRWMPIAAAAAAVALLVGGLLVIAGRDDESPVAEPIDTTDTTDTTIVTSETVPDASAPASTVPDTTTPPSALPVDQLYETIGSVIEDGSGARLCFSVLESLPPQCGIGLPLAGWSWDAIDVERVDGSTTWVDQIYLTGTFDASTGTLTVVDVRLPTDADRERMVVFPTLDFSVPCPEPEGGWPARKQEWPGGEVSALDGYAGAWVDESQQVMTVKFTGDLDDAESGVRQYYSGTVCMVPAQHSAAELSAIQDQLMQMSSIQFLGITTIVDATGEWLVAETMVPDPARQAAFDEQFGDGVVRLTPHLRPLDEAPEVAVPQPTTAAGGAVTAVESIGVVIESADHGPRLCVEGVLDSSPPQCAGGPVLDGFTWDAIDAESSLGSTTWGTAYVNGDYDPEADVLTVREQRTPTVADSERYDKVFLAPDHSVPCEAPPGGWPESVDSEPPSDPWPSEDLRAIDGYVGAWQEPGQPMVVKVTGDVEVAEAAIAELTGVAVCVLPATRSADELRSIWTSVEALDRFNLVQVIVDATGEWVLAVPTAPQPELQAELDAQYGPGLVRIQPLLRPTA